MTIDRDIFKGSTTLHRVRMANRQQANISLELEVNGYVATAYAKGELVVLKDGWCSLYNSLYERGVEPVMRFRIETVYSVDIEPTRDVFHIVIK